MNIQCLAPHNTQAEQFTLIFFLHNTFLLLLFSIMKMKPKSNKEAKSTGATVVSVRCAEDCSGEVANDLLRHSSRAEKWRLFQKKSHSNIRLLHN